MFAITIHQNHAELKYCTRSINPIIFIIGKERRFKRQKKSPEEQGL